MSIPVDIPGGEAMHEWPAPHMQAGVEELQGGSFRGIVLIGAADGGQPHTHACEGLHALRETAYRDAVDYIAAHKSTDGALRDDRSAHL